MKTQYCDECMHREWGKSGLTCKRGHKPRFYKPTSGPYQQDWGWKRKCADFALGDHVYRLTPGEAKQRDALRYRALSEWMRSGQPARPTDKMAGEMLVLVQGRKTWPIPQCEFDAAVDSAAASSNASTTGERPNRRFKMTFDEWFESKQGEPYDSMFMFAKMAWDHQQAEIDELMLEFCPDQMTPEQIAEYERHQITVPNA